MPTKTKPEFDIVLYGATGFTGKLTAEYLAARMIDTTFTFALAGRDTARLEDVKDGLAAINPACNKMTIIAADAHDQDALESMVRRTQVVLSTVGPYAKYGEPLIRACAEQGTDYVDITGEVGFVADMIEKYDAIAQDNGARIVSCCGFDSIPADLGTWLAVGELGDEQPIELNCYLRFSSTNRQPLSSISGGTWQSALGFMRLSEIQRQRQALADLDEFAGIDRHVRLATPQPHYRRETSSWAIPAPLPDIEVVMRSASLMKRYGPDFQYGHYFEVDSIPTLLLGAWGAGTVFTLAQFKPTRDLLKRLRPAGEGPNEEERARNSFCLTIVGSTASGRRVIVEVSGGDPGYGETSRMVSEAALCLAQDRRRLNRNKGLITPAAAMGKPLLERLQEAGLRFEVVESD
ncbi:MAG: saccharopine dehydrogenase NADP-binding domain-containing protein [Pseudomonadota bacterium]